jgi:ectoine hydroxylase-related dioxygenase (phytanoyl-CoA dioxygenase family)
MTITSSMECPAAPTRPATANYVERFCRDGYVVIEDALPRDDVDRLRAAFMRAMDEKVARFGLARARPVDGRDKANHNVRIDFRPEGGNHDLNRWNMHVPTHPLFLSDALLANQFALPVIRALLGPEPVAFLIASDTPYPGSGFQNIHQDFPRFGLTLNVPLVDFTEDNAPLEVWPGSHVRDGLFHTGKVDLRADEIKALVARSPGRRLLVPAGSLILRDQRLVHRGTANTGSSPRPCLSIWYKRLGGFDPMSLTIPVPHRAIADRMARAALWMRRQGRGSGPEVRSPPLLNLGNFFGRIVEETAASDRDYRRRIPKSMWDGFSPDLRQLLRYASVHGLPAAPRSWSGSAILVCAGAAFAARAWQLKLSGR